jgi:sugar O-acyltransferase (sialic acid O-acetyltransferase NeuD family)
MLTAVPKPLVIVGTGRYAEVARVLWEHDGGRRVAAFCVEEEFLHESELHGLPIVPLETVEERFGPSSHDMFVAVGARDVNRLRARLCADAKGKGYSLPTYVSPRATTFPDLTIGENSFVFEDNTIQPFVAIGDDVVVWSGNHIGHHARIGDHCFVTSHVVVSGNVTVGPYSFLGVNATIRDGIEIGEACVIGAGAILMRSTSPREVYVAARTRPDERTSDQIEL